MCDKKGSDHGEGLRPSSPHYLFQKMVPVLFPHPPPPHTSPRLGDVTRGRDQVGAESKTNPLRVAQLRVWERERFWKRLGVEGGQREPGEQKAKEEG